MLKDERIDSARTRQCELCQGMSGAVFYRNLLIELSGDTIFPPFSWGLKLFGFFVLYK
jgi:hypothetical protein